MFCRLVNGTSRLQLEVITSGTVNYIIIVIEIVHNFSPSPLHFLIRRFAITGIFHTGCTSKHFVQMERFSDIPVNDMLRVAVSDCLCNLGKIMRYKSNLSNN